MADESPRWDEAESSRSKGWNKLRGKIFDKENKLSKLRRHHGHSNEHDVDEFLRPGAGAPPDFAGPTGPKLDISAAKGHGAVAAGDDEYVDSNSARIGGAGGIPSYAPTREDMMSGKWKPIKPTRRPGLQVGFMDAPAETIGEGGDESEEAPLAIAQRRKQAAPRAKPPAARTPVSSVRREEGPMPGKLRRAPTGLAEDQPAPYPSHQPFQQHDAYSGFPPTVSRNPTLPVQQVRPPLSHAREEMEEEPIRPLRRAPTGLDEAREHRQRAVDPSSDLHLSSPESPPSSQSQQATYEQQMQRILTQSYAQPKSASRDQSPVNPPPRKASSAYRYQPDSGQAHPSRPSLRTHDSSPSTSPLREPQIREPPQAELRSPVDSTNMRKMRAEEGLAHRTSVQGIQGITGGDSSVAAALAKLSPGLDAPAPYSTQARSSFDSVRSGSDHSRYSGSPEPSMHSRQDLRHSVNSIESGKFLSPPSSSHGLPNRPTAAQRQSLEFNGPPPPKFHEYPDPDETSLSYGHRSVDAQAGEKTPREIAPPISVGRSPTSQRHSRDSSADEAFSHFSGAVSGLGSLFRLAAENTSLRVTIYDWARCAIWWFLKGKEGIEEYSRSQTHQSNDPYSHSRALPVDSLQQYHLNLAKSYWILTDIIPHILDNAQADPRSQPASQSLSAVDLTCDDLTHAFKTLSLSMRRHNALPPPQEKLTQGLDNNIWSSVGFGRFPPDWQWVLSGRVFASPRQSSDVDPLTAIPLHDTRSLYCYGRIFVSAAVALGDDKPLMEPFECVLSFVRAKLSAEAEVILSAQVNDVNIHIRGAGEHGVHWEHTRFDHDARSLRIKLPQKLRLHLYLSPKDYNYLCSFHDNSQRTSQSLVPRKNERLLQTVMLRSFHYRDSLHPDEFPSNPVGVCKATLFEQAIKSDRNPRKIHGGYRFAVVNLDKTVRNVNISFGKSAPLEYNVSSSQPSFQFQLNEAGRRRSAHVLFEDLRERDLFRDLVSGMVLGNNESVLCHVPVSSIAFSRATNATNLAPAILKWGSLQVVDEDDPNDPQRLSSSADVSETLRVMMYSKTGSVVDRMNDALVDLKIRLEPAYAEQLQIYRSSERHDMTIAVGPDPAETNELRQIFDVVTSGPHMSAYTFNTLKDLHMFQKAITGFMVTYDGVASSFSIPRRKPGSVVAKHLESKDARVQIVQRERVIQLIAFFNDYILADSMNFELKRTDQFDRTDSKTLGYGVKIVDAKFVLPGSNKDDPVREGAVRDASAKYTAFDTHEYAAEHDDITISFRSEQERDAFTDALPAPVSSGKKFTLRRRI